MASSRDYMYFIMDQLSELDDVSCRAEEKKEKSLIIKLSAWLYIASYF